MSSPTPRAAVLAALARLTGRAESELTDELELVADLGIDSLKSVQLIAELEDELELEMPEDLDDDIATVGALLALVDGLASP
ncbi:MAG: phosphopantetheine-binding protein [Acidobacteriota bacterium]